MESKTVPEEFYRSTTFYTLAGTAGAVWLLCVVVGSLDIDDKHLDPIHYRIIALVASMLISVMMIFKNKIIKAEYWLFAFFNGLLIFVNASGINAITANNKFGYVVVSETNTKKESMTYLSERDKNISYASILPLKFKNISWWEDNSLYVENEKLKLKISKKIYEKDLIINNLKDSISMLNVNHDLIKKKYLITDTLRDNFDNKKIKSLEVINKKHLIKISELNNFLLKIKSDLDKKELIIKGLNSRLNNIKDQTDYISEIKKLKYDVQMMKKKYIECLYEHYNSH